MRLRVNGEERSVEASGATLLLEVLRDQLRLTGTKEGCGVGECGLCSVLVDGLPVSSCIYLACCAQGKEVWTVEGLATSRPEVARAFVEHEGMQCGICTPGQVVMAAAATAEPDLAVSEEARRRYLAGNLCRCTGYRSILEALEAVVNGRA